MEVRGKLRYKHAWVFQAREGASGTRAVATSTRAVDTARVLSIQARVLSQLWQGQDGSAELVYVCNQKVDDVLGKKRFRWLGRTLCPHGART